MTTASSRLNANLFAQNPFLVMSAKIFNVYNDAVQENMESLTVSSAKIIQEETAKAWINAAQSCSKALAQNALSNQQQALARLAHANQKAFGIWAWDLNPFKM